MSRVEQNLNALNISYPELAGRLKGVDFSRIKVVAAADGAPAYVVEHGGGFLSVTNRVNPLEIINQQLSALQEQLLDFSKPVLVVGFYPGIELIHLFNNREQVVGNHCDQTIWVVIDSMIAFCGFLQSYDARAVLTSKRVRFIWWEDLSIEVDWLRAHPAFPYTFTFISGASEETLDKVLAPLVALIQEREREMEQWHAENVAYYNALSDEVLAKRLAEKGRVMFPSCSWSTVVQYSVRDTAEAFERAGWKTSILISPGQLTAYYVIRTLHEEKPDLFLYINHLRQEVADVVPDNLLVVTWVQDAMPAINNRAAAETWNRMSEGRCRDLLVGYTDQLKAYGYREDRLAPLGMIVNRQIFRSRELTAAQRERYGCDLCFASNCGIPTERLVREVLVDLFKEHGYAETQLMDFHDRLWTLYRAGETITGYHQLIDYLGLEGSVQDSAVQLLFWRLNDVIYRHVVLEWLDEYAQDHPAFRLHLYGKGWELHPRFSKYAKGLVAHGNELAAAYQSARYNLHLNSVEGKHQRLWEVACVGGNLLTRQSRIDDSATAPVLKMLRKVAGHLFLGQPLCDADEYEEELGDWVAAIVDPIVPDSGWRTKDMAKRAVLDALRNTLGERTDWVFGPGACSIVSTKENLFSVLDVGCSSEIIHEPACPELPAAFLAFSVVGKLVSAVGQLVGAACEEPIPFTKAVSSELDAYLDLAVSLLMKVPSCELMVDFSSLTVPGRRFTFRVIRHLLSEAEFKTAQLLLDGLDATALPFDLRMEHAILSARLSAVPERWDICLEEVARQTKIVYDQDGAKANVAVQLALKEFVEKDWFNYERALPYFEWEKVHGRLTDGHVLDYASMLAACRTDDTRALESIAFTYAENPVLCNGYASYGWQRYVVFDFSPEKALRLVEQDRAEGRLNGQLLAQEAHLHAMLGRLEMAEELMERAYSIVPSSPSALSSLAWYYCRTERLDQLDRVFELVEVDQNRGLFPLQHQLVQPLGMMLQGQRNRAEQLIREFYAADPGVMSGYAMLGLCSYRMDGDADYALELMRRDVASGRLYACTRLIVDAFECRFGGKKRPQSMLSQWNAAESWMFHMGCHRSLVEDTLGAIHPLTFKIGGGRYDAIEK